MSRAPTNHLPLTILECISPLCNYFPNKSSMTLGKVTKTCAFPQNLCPDFSKYQSFFSRRSEGRCLSAISQPCQLTACLQKGAKLNDAGLKAFATKVFQVDSLFLLDFQFALYQKLSAWSLMVLTQMTEIVCFRKHLRNQEWPLATYHWAL